MSFEFKPFLKTAYFFSMCICLLSCSSKFTTVRVNTSRPATIIINSDSVKTTNNIANLLVARRQSFSFLIFSGSTSKTVNVDYVNYFNYYTRKNESGEVKNVVTKNSPKLNGYPRKIFINLEDTVSNVISLGKLSNPDEDIVKNNTTASHTSTYITPQKGDLIFQFSLPYVNSFYLLPAGQPAKRNTGFLGISGGVNYFHTHKQFFNTTVGIVTDHPVPLSWFHKDASGEWLSAIYATASNNHLINRLSLGYGVGYAFNKWDLKNPKDGRMPNIKTSHALGLVSSAYYRLDDALHIGIVYRPTFARLNMADHFKYEHAISLDLAWRFPLKNVNRASK